MEHSYGGYFFENLRIDVVDSCEVVLKQDLAFAGLRHRHIRLVLQNFSATSLVDFYATHSGREIA